MKNIIIAIAFLLMGCELVVDVDVPKRPAKLTVNGAFTEDSVFTVSLTKSKYVLDGSSYDFIPDARVEIKEDGETIDILSYVQYDLYQSAANKTPVPGKSYEIVVSAPGMETVNAQSTLPAKCELKDAVFEWKNSQGSQMDYNYVIDLTFQDNIAAEDYYEIAVFMDYTWTHPETGDTIHNFSPVHISTDNPAFTQENIEDVMFDDKLISGKEVKLRILGYDFSGGSETQFYVILRTLSKDLYRYKLTSQLQSNLGGDPFAQPVHVHNNINNGFGIFGGYQEHRLKATQ